MNVTQNAGKRTESAHPLFPANQVFLWLPGFTGNERPYCTYNEFPEHPAAFDRRRLELLPTEDENGASYIPPFPVSSETHISWHTNVTPPYPYHPVPLAHTLSRAELEDLGYSVMRMIDDDPDSHSDAQWVLRNEYKSFVLAALAQMHLLPFSTEDAVK